MNIIEFLFFIYLTLTTLLIIFRTREYSLVADRQQVIDMASCHSLPTVGEVGYSVLCYGVTNISEIARLLNCEYSRYEVILALNSASNKPQFEQIVKHYKMVKVSHTTHTEIGSDKIINLYRSRLRGYRRLVVVDVATTSEYNALNSALSIASYDYIIPTISCPDVRCNALLHLAIILTTKEHQGIELIRCYGASQTAIFQRDSLIERGGFAPFAIKQTPRNATLCIHISPFVEQGNKAENRFLLLISLLVFTACSIIIAMLISPIAALCAIVTTALAIVAALYTLKTQDVKNCSVKTLLYQIRNLTLFFRSRKFTFS